MIESDTNERTFCSFCEKRLLIDDQDYYRKCKNHGDVIIFYHPFITRFYICKNGIEFSISNGKILDLSYYPAEKGFYIDEGREFFTFKGYNYSLSAVSRISFKDIDINITPETFDDVVIRLNKLVPFL